MESSDGKQNKSEALFLSENNEQLLHKKDGSCHPIVTPSESAAWADAYKNELLIIKLINKSENYRFSIDDGSLLNMCNAMRFSKIDTLEKTHSMGLKIIPPGPVFHTWFARKITTIFNGSNYELNYVGRISKSADMLKNLGIPVFIVYTENQMTKDKIDEMNLLFRSHDNIVVLNIEED